MSAKELKAPGTKPPSIAKLSIEEIEELRCVGFRDRGITRAVCEFFGVKAGFDQDGEIAEHFYPYYNDGKKGYKVRGVANKTFAWAGDAGALFGIERFQGGGKRIVITEGEIDALSVAQASLDKWKVIYPVISLTSANGTKKLLEHRDFLRSFEEVVLWMDSDEAGEKAKEEAVKLIGYDKVKVVKSPQGCKDANDVLCTVGSAQIIHTIYDACPVTIAGIIGKEELWKALEEYNDAPTVPYPDCMKGVNSKLKGMRCGEIALFISGTGSGKSTLMREIMLHILDGAVPASEKIGVISLEEAPAETARKLSGMYLNRNPAAEEIPLDDLKQGFDKVFGDDRVMLLDHQGSISDGGIVSQLEYMALSGAKYIFIDHITILVSEGADGLTGNEAIDKVMNDLLRLVKQHNVWIGLVSHLRKAPTGGKSFEEGRLPSLDDIRGSGSIKQISFDVVAFARDMTAEDEAKRNIIKMAVLKSRFTGLTGACTGARYDHLTGRLSADSEEFTVL